MFDDLFAEASDLKQSFGFSFHESMTFIQEHSSEYIGTPVYNQFVRYCNAMEFKQKYA